MNFFVSPFRLSHIKNLKSILIARLSCLCCAFQTKRWTDSLPGGCKWRNCGRRVRVLSAFSFSLPFSAGSSFHRGHQHQHHRHLCCLLLMHYIRLSLLSHLFFFSGSNNKLESCEERCKNFST